LGGRQLLEKALGLPVYVENDCNVAALAEGHAGAGQPTGVMIYITVGSGIGGGVLKDGVLFEGGRFGEVEVGHLVVDPGGLLCPCGNLGCLEASCSGDGLGRLALASRPRFIPVSNLAWSLKPGARGIANELFHNYPDDPLAKFCIDHFIDRMGYACSFLVNLFNPKVIVMGGGVMQNQWLLEPILGAMEGRVTPQLKSECRIVGAALGKQVVPLGAALYARQKWIQK
jgi:glucokinase